MGYWTTVLRGAWDKTRHPLGWDRKKFAVSLVAVGGVIAAGLHYGWLAMFESASSLFWTAFAPAFATIVLFVWGVVETQAEMYRTASQEIIKLSFQLEKLSTAAIDYTAWKHVQQFSLRDASFLWCNKVPKISMPSDVAQWYNALSAAIKTANLKFVADYGATPPSQSLRQAQYHYQRQNPKLDTIITRQALTEFAEANNHDPIFLRES